MWRLSLFLLLSDSPVIEHYPTDTACVERLKDWVQQSLAWRERSHLPQSGSFAVCAAVR